MELNRWGVAAYRGQLTATKPQTLSRYAVQPAARPHAPSDRPPELVRRRRAPGRAAVAAPAVGRTRLLDLRPGDCAHLPVAVGESSGVWWSAPVTITGVLLIDTELVQVRWSPEDGQDPFAAHLLLSGPAYRAGAIRCMRPACDGHQGPTSA